MKGIMTTFTSRTGLPCCAAPSSSSPVTMHTRAKLRVAPAHGKRNPILQSSPRMQASTHYLQSPMPVYTNKACPSGIGDKSYQTPRFPISNAR